MKILAKGQKHGRVRNRTLKRFRELQSNVSKTDRIGNRTLQKLRQIEALDSSPAAPVVSSDTVAPPPTELQQPVERAAPVPPTLPDGIVFDGGQYKVDPTYIEQQEIVDTQRANEQAKIDLAAQAEGAGYPSVVRKFNFNPVEQQTPVEAEEARILDVIAQPGHYKQK